MTSGTRVESLIFLLN